MDRFAVDEGVVKIVFPTRMTIDSVEELDSSLPSLLRRRSTVPEPGKTQLERFKEAARNLETDDDPERFKEEQVKHRPVPEKAE